MYISQALTSGLVEGANRRSKELLRVLGRLGGPEYLANGAFNRLKARLVACEAVGRFNVDNKWSPTITMDSVRLIFVIAALNQCELLSLDVSGAYLRGKRRSSFAPVFLRLPPGLDDLRAIYTEVGPRSRSRFSFFQGSCAPNSIISPRSLRSAVPAGDPVQKPCGKSA